MLRSVLLAGLLLAGLAAGLPGQPAMMTPDLALAPIAFFITHAGDLAVDGQGNVWIVEVQGTVGGTQGRFTKVTPQGQVIPNAISGFSEVGDLVRGNDGNIYFWMNSAPGAAALIRVTPAGQVTSLGQFNVGPAAGICQDSAGGFYLGTRQPATGVWRLPASGTALVFHHPGFSWTDNLHLAIDAQNNLYDAGQGQLEQLLPGGATSPIYVPPQPMCPNCGIDIPDFALGYYGQILPLSRFYWLPLYGNSALLTVKALGLQAVLGSFGQSPYTQPPAIAPGVAGDYVFVQSGGLYRITGTPAIMTTGYLSSGQLQIVTDAPPSLPITVGVDQPNIVLSLPPFGTFHTSLGLQSTFFALIDGIGAFRAPDPGAVTPWTFLYTPPQVFNVQLTVESYVLTPFAANGMFLISNPVDVYL